MPAQSMTIADLEQQPGRCELVNGELITMSPTGPTHGRIASRIDWLLRTYIQQHGGEALSGDVGFIWDEHTVRAPDVAYLDARRAADLPVRGYLRQMPNLAVEVVSPNDHWSEVKAKVRGWLAHGTDMVWVVDPDARTVEVHVPGRPPVELDERATIDGGEALPGFSAPVAAFFPPAKRS